MYRDHANFIVVLRDTLADQVIGRKPITGVEVGVFSGTLSACLLEAFPSLTLYMVDPWESIASHPTMQGEDFAVAHAEAETKTLFAQQRRFLVVGCSPEAAGQFQGRSFDFAYIIYLTNPSL
jgi:hypothetical protein